MQQFCYYMVFINDFSRCCWLYPLMQKSEFFAIFLSFQKLVENQFDRKIKIFQSDGGGEFSNNAFADHLVSCSIQHQLSCPGTLQQNGITEKKHQHIIKLGLAILFEASIPLHYWLEAFSTINFLINRLPSTSLNMRSPYAILFNTEPDCSELRVFGSCCHPYLHNYTINKFDKRSLPLYF